MKECENRYHWDAANAAVHDCHSAAEKAFAGIMVICLIAAVLTCAVVYTDNTHYEEDYGLGSMVTTTMVYEGLTGDSFTGVVVRGATRDDPALTIRNTDGTERRIATEFLEPIR